MQNNKPSVYQQTLDTLKKNILSQKWKPGQRLPTMKQLSTDLGVSITSVREALKTLENDSIISIEHGRGMYVRNDYNANYAENYFNDSDDIPLISIIKARLLVEPEQAYLCAKSNDTDLNQQLIIIAEQLDSEMHVGDNFLDTDVKFHQLIAVGAKQPALLLMSNSLKDFQISSRKLTNTLPLMRTRAALYHQLIATAIATQNADEAKHLMTLHLKSMIESLNDNDQ